MISNSVTHLRSYTYTAITDIAGNSVPAPIYAEHRCQQVSESFMMFHNVLRVFDDILLVVQDVLHVFHNVSQCFRGVS